MKHLKSFLSVLLSILIIMLSCMPALAAERDIAPAGLCLEVADKSVTTVISFENGGSYTAKGTVDLSATEKNKIIESIESCDVMYDNELVIRIEPHDISATGSSEDLGNGYYSVTFDIPDTTEECFLTGLLPEKTEYIQQLLLNSYINDGYFEIEDIDFIDAEKLGTKLSGDSDLCWAGTASNMLRYSGWGKRAGFDTEDDIFEEFIGSFENDGNYIATGLSWFFNGNSSAFEGYQNTGGYLHEYDATELYKDVSVSAERNKTGTGLPTITDMTEALKEGKAVGLSVQWEGRTSGHALTLWGCITDKSYDDTEPEHYSRLIVSDSDNHETGTADRRTAPNTMDLHPLTVDEDTHELFLKYDNWLTAELSGYTVLTPYSADIPYETDERATLDRETDPDFKANSIQLTHYMDEIYKPNSNAYSGDVYLFADITNSGAEFTDGLLPVDVTVTDGDGKTVYKERRSVDTMKYSFKTYITKLSDMKKGSYKLDIVLNPDAEINEALLYNNRYSADIEIENEMPDTSGISITAEVDKISGSSADIKLAYPGLKESGLYGRCDSAVLCNSLMFGGSWSELAAVDHEVSADALPQIVKIPVFAEKVRFAAFLYENGKAIKIQSDEYEFALPRFTITRDRDNPMSAIKLEYNASGFTHGEKLGFGLMNTSGEKVPVIDGELEIFAVDYQTGTEIRLKEPEHVSVYRNSEPMKFELTSWDENVKLHGHYSILIRFVCDGFDNTYFTNQIGEVTAPEEKSGVVTDIWDIVDEFDNQTSLREAVAYCESSGDTVTFSDGLSKVYVESPISINGSVTLEGRTSDSKGERFVHILSSLENTMFEIAEQGRLDISNTLIGGIDTSSGAIICNGGELSLSNCLLGRCTTSGDCGAIYFNGGRGTIRDTAFYLGSGKDGSVILMDNSAEVEMLNSIMYDNTVNGTCAVYNKSGSLNIINSTLAGFKTDNEDKTFDIILSEGETNIVNSIITDTYVQSRSVAGKCHVYGSALHSAAESVIVDELTAFYENKEIILPDQNGQAPDCTVYLTVGVLYPRLSKTALNGYLVSERDGMLSLSKDGQSLTPTEVKTVFTSEELAVDSVGRQRRGIYGSYSMLDGEYYLGDADGNETVDIIDASVVQRFDARISVPYDDDTVMHGDIDGDKEISITDAAFIQRYCVRIKTPYPVGELKIEE